MKRYKIGNGSVYCVTPLAKNSDLVLVLCGEDDATISIFSTKTNINLWKLNNDYRVSCIDLSPNDDIVAIGGSKNCLHLTNAAHGDSIFFVDVGSSICRVLFLSQQKIACGLGDGTVAIVCWQTQKIEKILKVGERRVYALAISPVNNNILLTGDGAGVIRQTIISAEKTVMVYEGPSCTVNDLKFLSCGNLFVSGSGNQTARLFALDQRQAIRVFKGHADHVMSVSLIHDDEILITTSLTGEVKVWKIESGECLTNVETEEIVFCGAVLKNEQSLVVGGSNGTVTMFSLPPRVAVSLDRTLKLCL